MTIVTAWTQRSNCDSRPLAAAPRPASCYREHISKEHKHIAYRPGLFTYPDLYLAGVHSSHETDRHFAKMHHNNYAAFIAIPLILFKTCVTASRFEDQCISYYETGENFDITALEGERYAVFFWPPNQRSRDECEKIVFKKLSPQDVETANNECKGLNVSSDGTVMEAKYINSVGKQVKLMYYGETEVKRQYRSCERISKYILKRVNEDYVLGINCSAGGRGVLLARSLPGAAQTRAVADGIEIMTGRDGSPDCKLT